MHRLTRPAPLASLLLPIALGCAPSSPTPKTAEPKPATTAGASPVAGPPVAARRPVVERHHGVDVVDDYRWLEDGASPEVKAWSDAQSAWARAHLDALPRRDALRKRFRELLSTSGPDHFDVRFGGPLFLFAVVDRPPKQQPLLVRMRSAKQPETEQVVLDPNVLDPSGGTTIDWFVPTRDGKRVAVSLSQGGSESGTLHVYDVATGKEIDAPIPRVHGGTAGGSLAWNSTGTGFWYTRYPREGERPKEDLDFYQQVWFHEVGADPKTDRYVLGESFPRIAEIELVADRGFPYRWVLATVKNGDGGEHAFHVLDTQVSKTGEGEKGWTRVSDFADGVVAAALGEDGGLWLKSIAGAPRGRVLRVPLAKPELAKAKVVVPESDAVIDEIVVGKERLFVHDLIGGPSRVRVFDTKSGKLRGTVALPETSAVRALVGIPGEDGGKDDVLVRVQTYTEPPAWYRVSGYGPTHGDVHHLQPTALRQTSPADFSGVDVVRETCASKDGTEVPLTILRKTAGAKSGARPTILYGYGGYGVSLVPRFQPKYLPWLEAGGAVAIANLRGGGELGEAWHEAGKLTKKQNVFDDFTACARHLIDGGVTEPARLAIMGASNGGLLMGAAMTQHPELFGAVVSFVGIYDMLRVETTPNGAFNVTEFGTVKDPAQFAALHAYSPYHHVVDGKAYPPVLFLTGANDPRVDPYQSRKMTARLQAANPKGVVLLRTSGSTGHGLGTPLDAQIEEQVDVYAFLFAHVAR